MLMITHNVAVSNGMDLSEITDQAKVVYKNGVVAYIKEGLFLLVTEKLIPTFQLETYPDDIISLIQTGKLDLWPLRKFNGKDLIEDFLQRTIRKKELGDLKKIENAKVDEICSKYPQVSEDLKDKMLNLDMYYDYIDDGSQWRAAKQTHDIVINALKEVGAENLYKEFSDFTYNKVKQYSKN